MSDLEEIGAFRNRLVVFVNYVIASYEQNRHSYSGGPDESAMTHIRSEQVALTQEYGRLRGIVASHAGIAQMTIPAIGIVSRDVIIDTINRVGWHNWGDAAEMARQHLDLAIGQMQARPRPKPKREAVAGEGGVSKRIVAGSVALVGFLVTGLATGVLQDIGRAIWRAIFPG